MNSKKVDVRKVAETLRQRCPFIVFAMLGRTAEKRGLKRMENMELSVFLESDTGDWHALEQIIPAVLTAIPEEICDITLLNRVDPATRLRAVNALCLFVRDGNERCFHQFIQRTRLDYRIMRAHLRRRGTIDND